MSQAISDFVNAFNGGMRPNRFVINMPKIGGNRPFHIRSASLPAASTSVLQIPYRGRVFKMPGNRTFGSWIITVLDDTEPQNLWKNFHTWANEIQNHVTNISYGGDFTGVMSNATIQHLNMNGVAQKTVVLNRCWPSEVGEVRLSMDDNESLSTFNVTLEYQYIQSF